MKKKILYILLLGVLVLNYSCDEKLEYIPANFNKILSLQTANEQTLTLFNIGLDGNYTMKLYKGGYQAHSPSQAFIRSWTDKELQDYAFKTGKAYTLLSDTLYKIQKDTLFYGSDETFKTDTIVFKTTSIDKILKADTISNYVVPIIVESNTDSVNDRKKMIILKPKVVIPSIDYVDNTILRPIAVIDTNAHVIVSGSNAVYKFQLSIPFETPWPFQCKIEADPTLAKPGFSTIPASAYSFENNGVVTFQKDKKLSDTLKITINNIDSLGNTFVIPIKITDISLPGFIYPKSNFNLYQTFSKIPLTANMLSTNAQEPTEGPIANLIDGNPNTYFHTKYTGGGYTRETHYFQIKLKDPISICRFWFQNRNNASGIILSLTIWVSDDGTNWRQLKTISDGLPTRQYSKYLSPIIKSDTPYKYFRFSVNKSASGDAPIMFALAEFELYGK